MLLAATEAVNCTQFDQGTPPEARAAPPAQCLAVKDLDDHEVPLRRAWCSVAALDSPRPGPEITAQASSNLLAVSVDHRTRWREALVAATENASGSKGCPTHCRYSACSGCFGSVTASMNSSNPRVPPQSSGGQDR
jgi:hypothetical protein